jgi:rhamnose transport system ATP-binding protein
VNTLLQAIGISKHFSGVQALKDVSFELHQGTVHALVGENGAGKSTLIKILTGAYQADEGILAINGQTISENDPVVSRALGIAAIHQQPALFPDLTVAENIALGLEPWGWWRRIRWGARRQRARELLSRVGGAIHPDAVVRSLTMPEQQLVEIARAVGANSRILIMDEPTASLSDREVQRLFQVIRDLRGQGVGIIYISHRLDELTRIADHVTVLRDGQVVATRPMGDVDRAELIRLMVGRQLTAIFPKQEVQFGNTVLEACNLGCRASGVHGVSFGVRAGEILGFAGLVGAGRTELARILFGLTPADSGEIRLRGRAVAIDSPPRAIELGIAYVPEDRRHFGVILDMAITPNASLAILGKISEKGWIEFAKEKSLARAFVDQLAIKTNSVDAIVGNLSGGNQQKVALARWLATNPAVLILDEPTQGVDVGAKAEIHRIMSNLASKGMAIIMISSELPEILGMSDRIAVMHGGTLTGILNRAEATQENVLALALGHGSGVEPQLPGPKLVS